MNVFDSELINASEKLLDASNDAESYYQQVKHFETELLAANEKYINEFKTKMDEHQKLVNLMMEKTNKQIIASETGNKASTVNQKTSGDSFEQIFEPTK